MHILCFFTPNMLPPRNTFVRRVLLTKLAEIHGELKTEKKKQREEFKTDYRIKNSVLNSCKLFKIKLQAGTSTPTNSNN